MDDQTSSNVNTHNNNNNNNNTKPNQIKKKIDFNKTSKNNIDSNIDAEFSGNTLRKRKQFSSPKLKANSSENKDKSDEDVFEKNYEYKADIETGLEEEDELDFNDDETFSTSTNSSPASKNKTRDEDELICGLSRLNRNVLNDASYEPDNSVEGYDLNEVNMSDSDHTESFYSNDRNTSDINTESSELNGYLRNERIELSRKLNKNTKINKTKSILKSFNTNDLINEENCDRIRTRVILHFKDWLTIMLLN